MLEQRIRRQANRADAAFLQRFFRTGPGEYGEGDRFLGIRVPVIRRLAREYQGPLMPAVRRLLRSRFHEERLLALVLLQRAYRNGTEADRERVFRYYLAHTRFINNWDLVDLSAPGIVGAHLGTGGRAVLKRLAGSTNLWERRIAMVATHHAIRAGDPGPALAMARQLLQDRHDLIHKAVGWMLREVGKKDQEALTSFLDRHAAAMPRTMLRYAVERFPEARRRRYLALGRPLRRPLG